MSQRTSLSPQFVERARRFVRRHTGLVFQEARRSAFESGLSRAMRRAKPTAPDVYLSRLDVEPALLDDLVGEITVGETYFFREPQQFAVIRDEILPTLLPGAGRDRRLRLWSAGCATGEEPYTLAMVLRQQGLNGSAHIVATDLSRRALGAARRGRYTRWSLRGIPDDAKQRYFEPAGEQFDLAATVRKDVEFRYLNLAEDAYPSLASGIWGMDLILCRNVLIYFGAETIARVARRLIDSLSEDGWLLLGASDPAIGDLVPCGVVVTAAGLAYRRPGRETLRPRMVATPAFSLPPLPDVPPPEPPNPVVEEEVAWSSAVDAARAYAAREFERAAELAGRSIQRDGSDPALWIVLVRALANRGALREAGHACAAALDRHRTSAELTYLHAVLLAEAGRHKEAATAARRALYLDRRLVVGHLALGAALARLGDPDGARRAVLNARRLLAAMPPEAIVSASDGEPAGRLAEMTRVQLRLLPGATP